MENKFDSFHNTLVTGKKNDEENSKIKCERNKKAKMRIQIKSMYR